MHLNGRARFNLRELEAILQAIAFVTLNPEKQINADGLALDFELPIKKLQRGFVKHTGMTVHTYLLHIRMEKAKNILSDPETEIKVIPKVIGFCSLSHFGYCFKRLTGLTPMEYRYQNVQLE